MVLPSSDELDGRLDVGGLKVELAGELGDKIHETPCGKGAFAAQSYQGYHPSQKTVLGRATKMTYLLRLTRMGRPSPGFPKIRKPSTCGFYFAKFGTVEAIG